GMEDPTLGQRDALELGFEDSEGRLGQLVEQAVAEVGAGRTLARAEIGQRCPKTFEIDRLAEQAGLGEGGGEERVLVAAQEEERHAAPLELMAEWEAGIAIQVDVDDGAVDMVVLQ